MATMHQLVDLTKCSLGGTIIARPSEARTWMEEQRLRSGSDTRIGPYAIDTVQRVLKASVQAEDPLALPTILGLTSPQTFIAGGRLVNASSYEDITLLRMMLTSFGITIADNAVGTLALELQNRATEGSAIADEYSVASGAKQMAPTRKGTIRIRSDATFTDDDSTEITLPGIERVQLTGRAERVYTGCSNPADAADQNLCDICDPMDWLITGSMTIRDTTIDTTQDLRMRLAALKRGDLAIPCMLSGIQTDATPPADKIVTIARVKFHSPGGSFRTKQGRSDDLQFDAVLLAADGTTEKTLAQMVVMADRV